MKSKIIYILFAGILTIYSFECFSQKKENSLKYDMQLVEFKKMFIHANLEKNKQNYDNAFFCYYYCLKIMPKNAAVFYELAQICLYLNNYTEAEEYINKALKYSPNNVECERFLEDLYIKLGKKK